MSLAAAWTSLSKNISTKKIVSGLQAKAKSQVTKPRFAVLYCGCTSLHRPNIDLCSSSTGRLLSPTVQDCRLLDQPAEPWLERLADLNAIVEWSRSLTLKGDFRSACLCLRMWAQSLQMYIKQVWKTSQILLKNSKIQKAARCILTFKRNSQALFWMRCASCKASWQKWFQEALAKSSAKAHGTGWGAQICVYFSWEERPDSLKKWPTWAYEKPPRMERPHPVAILAYIATLYFTNIQKHRDSLPVCQVESEKTWVME